MLNAIQRFLPTFQGRLTTGIAFIAAIVVGLGPDVGRPFDLEKSLAVVATGAAWLFSELSGAGAPRQHDVDLFTRVVTALPPYTLEFLKSHDFGVAFRRSKMEGLLEINDWFGARSEFVDRQIQKRWEKITPKIGRFVELYAMHTIPLNNNMEFATVHPTIADPENPSESTLAEIKQLNDASLALYNALNEFERFARKRLGQ